MQHAPIETPWTGHSFEGEFLSFVSWAIRDPEVVSAFRQATGNRWTPGIRPEERLIDQATGADRAFVEAFVTWIAENLFGLPDDVFPEKEAC